jgi:hypothetical protein
MRKLLSKGKSLVSVTMDIRRFYHNVSPFFMLRDEFLRISGIILDADQRKFTADLLASMQFWYAQTPDYRERPEGGLPVGLSASKIISNVILIEFDRIIQKKLKPAYYGRYVDDIFLVAAEHPEISSGDAFLAWMASLAPHLLHVARTEGEAKSLFFRPKYASDSSIEFSGDKQKIFILSGRDGIDLVDQIEDQIRQKSSEHRLLPMLPEDDREMISNALLVTPDATLQADALRKADVVSVRRLGFALLLRDIEAHARDLRPPVWAVQRHAFYGLVLRHVITPKGFFNYHAYLDRVFGLMIACGDNEFATSFLDRFDDITKLLFRTSTAGTDRLPMFKSCIKFYGEGFYRTAIQSSTVKHFSFSAPFLTVLKRIKSSYHVSGVPQTAKTVAELSASVLRCDFGRRSYKDYWFESNPAPGRQYALPSDRAVRRALRLDGITRFRKRMTSGLKRPHWPAMAFPTRPLSVAEIIFAAPRLLESVDDLAEAIFSLRGARIVEQRAPSITHDAVRKHVRSLNVMHDNLPVYRIAVTSFLSDEVQWKRAVGRSPDMSLRRYKRINRLINDVLACEEKVNYVTFPEASLPRKWAVPIAIKLARLGISLIAGIENWRRTGPFRNDALVSLSSRWPGYASHVLYTQPKILPAHHELASVLKANRVFYKHDQLEECRPIYRHGSHFFSVLLCSDLTNIDNRRHAQGFVDSLFALEWNPDTTSFSALVESAALDLHAYIVQVNNRSYGDSRVRAPRRKDYERDVVRLKGGDTDYFVVASLDVEALRAFHMQPSFMPSDSFKPLPIGFEISADRSKA